MPEAPRPNPDASIPDLSWAAGFFDGEGSIYVNRCIPKQGRGWCYQVRLALSQRVRAPLEKWQQALNEGGKIRHFDRKDGRVMEQLFYTGPTACRVLRKLLPCFIVKNAEAELALKLQDRIDKRIGMKGTRLSDKERLRRQDYYEQMKRLKHGS